MKNEEVVQRCQWQEARICLPQKWQRGSGGARKRPLATASRRRESTWEVAAACIFRRAGRPRSLLGNYLKAAAALYNS